MARFHSNILHWGNKEDGPDDHKNIRRGAGEDAFWPEDELVDYRRTAKNKKKNSKRPGCPGNDGKAHVYVWETVRYTYWNRTYEIEEKRCCGCLKKVSSRNWRRL